MKNEFSLKITAVLITALITTSGCTSFLVDYDETAVPHEFEPYERPPVEIPSVSDLEELSVFIYELISQHENGTTVQYLGIDSEDIQTDAQDISQEILKDNPVAAYAVESITVTATRLISSSELNIYIEYKRTAEQVQSIVQASTQRYMITQLLDIISQYREEAVFRTNMQLEKDEIVNQITELYYQNPRRMVMMPFVTVEIFPEPEPGAADDDIFRIYEIKFGYPDYDPPMLRDMRDSLTLSIRQNAARADGDKDSEILLSIVSNLIAGVEYDEGTASSIFMHSQQNTAATAFGALVRGSAVGEGFAMAFKALCDEMRLDCRVVTGYLDDIIYAWNIVQLEGDYYHIDTAMCATEGLEAGFLKTDADLSGRYMWDRAYTPRCEGPLTLEDILSPNIPDIPLNPDNE